MKTLAEKSLNIIGRKGIKSPFKKTMEESSLIEAIKLAALHEIKEQTFAITKQLLAVYTLVYDQNLPLIEEIILDSKDEAATVYFSIADEPFYFVIYVDTCEEIRVSFVDTVPGNRVYMTVSSEEAELSELMSKLSVKPNKTWEIGTPRSLRNTNLKHNENGFTLESEEKPYIDVEQKLMTLLECHEEQLYDMITAHKQVDILIRIVYYGDKSQMGGIVLNSMLLNKISSLGASIDIDLYAFGENMT